MDNAGVGSSNSNASPVGQVDLLERCPGELRLKETLLRAAAASKDTICGYGGSNNNNNNNKNIRSSGSRMEVGDPFAGGGVYRQVNKNSDAQQQQQQQQQHPTGIERTSGAASLLELHDDENNLRTTCDGCTIGKIKCDGGHPCKRCLRRGSECVYREKKRCGPKRRKSASTHESDDDGSNNGGDNGNSTLYLGEGGGGGLRVLTVREQGFLSKFFSSVNKFIPLTCITVIRDAMNPLQLDIVDGITPTEAERNIYHSRKAVLFGCVAVGAVFSGDQGSAGVYLSRAQVHLKDCFDALLPEVVCCYLVMVVYHIHFLDRAKVYRYMGFAQQAYRELVQPQQLTHACTAYVRDSLLVLSTFLHVTCRNEIRVDPLYLEPESNPEPGGGRLSRIIALFSHMLVQLHWRDDSEAAAKFSPDKPLLPISTLEKIANEADLLLSMIEEPGSLALVVLKTMKGYFLLLRGKEKEREVLDCIAKPVAKALGADPGVLNFPLCWTMCKCVCAFLRRKGCHALADGMDDAMLPLQPTLAYANLRCRVSDKVNDVYSGKAPDLSCFPSAANAHHSRNGHGHGHGITPGFPTSPPRTPASVSVDESSHYLGASRNVPPQPPRSSGLGPAKAAGRHSDQQQLSHPRYAIGPDDGDSGAKRRRGPGPEGGAAMIWPTADGKGNNTNSGGGGGGGGGGGAGGGRTIPVASGGGNNANRGEGGMTGGGGGGHEPPPQDSHVHSHYQHLDGHVCFSGSDRLERIGSISTITSMGLDGGGDYPHSLGSQPSLSFDLGATGPDVFFQLGLKTDFGVAATAAAATATATAATLEKSPEELPPKSSGQS
ncbi:unnamed protein product [Pylaiella littoralis]